MTTPEIKGKEFVVSRGSGTHGRVRHIHESDNPESICGMKTVTRNQDGEPNRNAVYPFRGLDMCDKEQWCHSCLSMFEHRYEVRYEEVVGR